MELPGSGYLFNLSLIAVTFTTVSTLVMLLRQTMGGKLGNFDVHLITSFVSFGFAQALTAILPPLVALFGLPPRALWAISSGLAAILLGCVIASVVSRRRRVSSAPMAQAQMFSFWVQGVVAIVLMVNAMIWQLQGVRVFAGAITISVAVTIWAFVRRIVSLLGEEDWDPKLG